MPRDTVPNADHPIETAAQDRLGRSEFAKALATMLGRQTTDAGVVIGLRGDWGSGKSSLKNLIRENLGKAEKKNRVKILEFNPWQWGQGEAITRAFFRELSATLGKSSDGLAGRARARAMRKYGQYFGGASKTATTLGGKAGGLATWVAGVGVITVGAGVLNLADLPIEQIGTTVLISGGVLSVLSKILEALSKEPHQEPIDLVRADLEKKLKTLKRNMLVVVDDLDRLEPDEIRLVIRHIKANANLPRITFLVLFESSIVEAALDLISNNDGRRYLEKIVQATFDLPVIEGARVQGVLIAELNALMDDMPPIDGVRWGNLWHGGMKSFFESLRDVHRFMNAARVHFELHRGDVLEIDIVDFLGLEALRTFQPRVFDGVFERRARMIAGASTDPDDRESLHALVALGDEPHRPAVQQILTQMFPTIGWAFGGSYYSGGEWRGQWVLARRICTDRHFDRYFALRVPDGQISEARFQAFLKQSGDRGTIQQAFAELEQEGLLGALLERLDELNRHLPVDNMDTLLPALFDVGERLSDAVGFDFNSPYLAAWRTASWYLKSEPDLGLRGDRFIAALENSTGLSVPATLIGLDMDRRAKGDAEERFCLDDAHLKKAKAMWARKAAKVAANPVVFLTTPNLLRTLYSWQEFSTKRAPRAWVAKAIADPQLLPKYLAACVQRGTSHVIGDYVGSVNSRIDRRTLEDFTNLATLKRLVSQLDVAQLSPAEQEARTLCLKVLDSKPGRARSIRGNG